MPERTHGNDPERRVVELLDGALIAQIMSVAVRLGLPDHLAAGTKSPAELADLTGCEPDAMSRFLRAWCALGMAELDEFGRLHGMPLAIPLTASSPRSLRGLALLCGREYHGAWGELVHTLRTGEPGFDHRYGRSLWAHLADDDTAGAAFDQTMSFNTEGVIEQILDRYDFSTAAVVADIGAAEGALLAAVLDRYPRARGLAFDLPAAVERCRARFARRGLAERCDIVAGDFLDHVPPGADIYVLKAILHNWDDERAKRILRNCAAAMPSGSRLLVIENAAPERPTGPGATEGAALRPALRDLEMLVLLGGRDRTVSEHAELIRGAGFTEVRVLAGSTRPALLEAINSRGGALS